MRLLLAAILLMGLSTAALAKEYASPPLIGSQSKDEKLHHLCKNMVLEWNALENLVRMHIGRNANLWVAQAKLSSCDYRGVLTRNALSILRKNLRHYMPSTPERATIYQLIDTLLEQTY